MENAFYFGLWLHVIILLVCLVLFVVLAIISRKILDKAQYFFILLIVGVISLFFGVKTTQYIQDCKYVRGGEYFEYEGTVIKYAYVAEGNDPNDPIKKFPIFQHDEISPTEMFYVGSVDIGHRYKLIYLPHTRHAWVVEEISVDLNDQ